MTLRVGDTVKTDPNVRPALFANREGKVESLHDHGREVGVNLGHGVAWFRLSEVIRVDSRRGTQD